MIGQTNKWLRSHPGRTRAALQPATVMSRRSFLLWTPGYRYRGQSPCGACDMRRCRRREQCQAFEVSLWMGTKSKGTDWLGETRSFWNIPVRDRTGTVQNQCRTDQRKTEECLKHINQTGSRTCVLALRCSAVAISRAVCCLHNLSYHVVVFVCEWVKSHACTCDRQTSQVLSVVRITQKCNSEVGLVAY